MGGKISVLLIQPYPPEHLNKGYVSTQIPINLAYIASSLEEEGANAKLVDFCIDRFVKEKFLLLLDSFKPRMVGFTSMTPSVYAVRDISKIIKDHDKTILTVLGGIHVSALPKRTLEELPCIDIGVVGEGEETIKEIYRLMLSNKPIHGVCGTVCRIGRKIKVNPRRALIKDLDSISFPARHLLKVEKYNKSHVSRGFSRKHLRIMEIITSRGCPNQCIFCAGHINYGRSLRFRSYENIASEVESLIKNYKINHVSIEDDTFTINRKLAIRLCYYFKKKGITWNCNSRVNTVDLELLKLMKKSGCRKVSFGVESGSPAILRLIKKNITLEQVRNAFRWAKKAGIRYIEGTFILGSHIDETLEDIEKTKRMIFELMPDFLMLSIMCPFPGTEIYSMMNEKGLLDEDNDWSRYAFLTGWAPYRRLNHLTAAQLSKIQKDILKEYYSSPRYIFNQVRKIRSMGELSYFLNLGLNFISMFILRKKRA